MKNFIKNDKYKMVIYRNATDFYISRETPKVIFTIHDQDDNTIDLMNQIQNSCDYKDFIDAVECISECLFSETSIESIFININNLEKKDSFGFKPFIKDGYNLQNGSIVKLNPEKIKKRG